ncbi:hypothetical protein NQ176_g11407 [Zarea fungicola]|uniref:Uncharacterized protein n=1 Tax=Zarea fungicola TaxID=93591 RepID=A0ACC1MBE6_9HYPO|nr:hypothetical protein NQ176_g11407 [Lecanicillium fungicola]
MTESDHRAEYMRSIVAQKAEKLQRGDAINPPCDRCRRLRLHCLKHLTACQGCTKKHAKCTWRAVTEEEETQLGREMGVRMAGDAQFASEGISPKEELPPPLGMDAMSMRPGSRAETETSSSMPVYSPGALSSARSDLSTDPGRLSLPPVMPGLSGPPPMQRGRDPSRLNQMASVKTEGMRPPYPTYPTQLPPPYPPQHPPSR